MLVSGFTFIRNAVKLDYPVYEAITAVLPIVDEFIVNISRMPDEEDDGTKRLIEAIDSPKIRIVESIWNPNLCEGGYVYAQQTNIALFNCTGNWAVYVQCDEVVHENGLDSIYDAMKKYEGNSSVDALTLWQENFWGDFYTRFKVFPWINRRKCWIIKPHHFVLSRGDAANFTVHPKYKEKGRKLRVVQTDAHQFHYGSVRSLKALQANNINRQKYWSEKTINIDSLTEDMFYNSYPVESFEYYTGSHPEVMKERIKNHEIKIDLSSDAWSKKFTFKEKLKQNNLKLKFLINEKTKNHNDYILVGKHS